MNVTLTCFLLGFSGFEAILLLLCASLRFLKIKSIIRTFLSKNLKSDNFLTDRFQNLPRTLFVITSGSILSRLPVILGNSLSFFAAFSEFTILLSRNCLCLAKT